MGIVYQPWPWLSLYGSFTESFGANNGLTADRKPLDPQQATQYEFGVKTEFLDGRLTSTLAFYHLTKSNIPTADTNTSDDPTDQVLIGEARSQGIEFDLSGQLTDKLNVIGSFSYTDGKITKDNDGFAGNPLFGVPEFFSSVWAKFQATEAFSFGSGIFAATESAGDRANSFDMPGYVRWDAMATYRFILDKSRMTLQLNVNNLLDERYYQNSAPGGQRLGVIPADPRTVLGSIRIGRNGGRPNIGRTGDGAVLYQDYGITVTRYQLHQTQLPIFDDGFRLWSAPPARPPNGRREGRASGTLLALPNDVRA